MGQPQAVQLSRLSSYSPYVGIHAQIMANYKLYGCPDEFPADTDKLRRGDIVGVTGHPAKTKKGELSVVPQQVQVLTPCLHMLPSMHYGLKDKVRWGQDIGLRWVVGVLGMAIAAVR